eukprot:m.268449 g.268449  ORF g.268449 m.268449 type:complete len:69 (+) comp40528_c0_seq3:1423-1629(+)
MAFFTGASIVPVLGFQEKSTLCFSDSEVYPTSSTCALTLTLPSQYKDYKNFKEKMAHALKNHGGFGDV